MTPKLRCKSCQISFVVQSLADQHRCEFHGEECGDDEQ